VSEMAILVCVLVGAHLLIALCWVILDPAARAAAPAILVSVARAAARQPTLMVGIPTLLASSVWLLVLHRRDPMRCPVLSWVALGALPLGLLLVTLGVVLAFGQGRRIVRAHADGGPGSEPEALWIRVVRLSGVVGICATAWWVLGWLLVFWIFLALG